jgi:prepilin-type processing-associated H-X9-DG protein
MCLPSTELEPARSSSCLRNVIAVIVVLLFLGSLLFPAVQAAREAARAMSCAGTFKFIGMDMHCYAQIHKCFPPAYVVDREGKPAHSWRMLLMECAGEKPLFRQYRFDEPWNSPHNFALASGVPLGMSGVVPLFHCICDRDSDRMDTSTVMVVGKGTISDGPTATSFKDITDGASYTILVAEMSESGIHWMEPRDLSFKDMSFRINDPTTKWCIRSKHGRSAHVGMCDGSVKGLSEDMDPAFIKGCLTIAGGEKIEDPNW